jgi:probable phosphoglycerate mutase
MKLIITRHGETEENKLGIFQGHLPGKLSPLGIEQAKKLAQILKEEKIDFIYSSDLTRSSDTAKEIAKFLANIPIKFVKELRERHLGELQGKNKSDLGWDNKKSHTLFLGIKGGEPMQDLYTRAEKFLHKILLKHHKDTVLFVAHNGINKALIAVITGKKYEDIKNMENHHNTSINIFEIDENKNYQMHAFNCTKHLE